ncbi:venom protease isoform X2 [Anabrus simplex]
MGISFHISGTCIFPWNLVQMRLLGVMVLLLLFSGHGYASCMHPQQCITIENCSLTLGNTANAYTLFPCGYRDRQVCCPPKQQPLALANKISLLPMDTCGVSVENKIIDGEDAIAGQFPWMALLGYKVNNSDPVQFLCGGSIITDRYILTAAHCLGLELADLVTVRLGELNLTSDPDCEDFAGAGQQVCADYVQDYPVESYKIHEKFSSAHLKNDIALIRLKRNITTFKREFIRPLCLPIGLNLTGNEEIKYQIAGWGTTDNYVKTGSPVLQHAMIQGVPRDDCNALQAPEVWPLDETQLCAGNTQGKDACKGDSGGPLMHIQNSTGKLYQIGIVSFGSYPCGGRDAPSVYTRVSEYINWILKNIES